ncbi:MAG TPA: hypothetical protein VHE78_16645 [Gemmatimonadaceae bacterium]|nr:hypothetical protein [Gemmatimonadaceae bacterium]
MTIDPLPARANGTPLRAMGSSIRRATAGRTSVDAPSTSTEIAVDQFVAHVIAMK